MSNRNATRRFLVLVAAIALVAGAIAWNGALADPAQSESNKRAFTEDFLLEYCAWANEETGTVFNPYWPMTPGYQLVLEGEDDGEDVELIFTVCDGTDICCDGADCETGTEFPSTEEVWGVETRVIEERELVDGELKEVSHNFFAICGGNNGVFYFGEDVYIFEDDGSISNDGAWRADGEDNFPGLIMPALFQLGARYFQEIAPEVAMDRAENAAMGLEFDLTDAGDEAHDDCVYVFETSALTASDRSDKIYCPGVGLVYDDGVELVDIIQH